MRILMAHNYYTQRGGEDQSFESEVRMLRDAGHDVVTYTERNERVASLGPTRTGIRAVWSAESARRVREQLRRTGADVLHVQNFFPLISPSVYSAARAEQVPVVQSLRNYRLLCPNGLFFRNGHVCEDCLHRFVPWPGVAHACYRDSRLSSAATGMMLVMHRALHTWDRQVDVFVTLSEFSRQKFIEGGLPPGKLVVKPNVVHPDPGTGSHEGGYFLFVGRLTREKGIATLLDAWERLHGQARLRIVGDGPLRSVVDAASNRLGGIECLGHRAAREVYDLMGQAAAVIVPSTWYETFGRVVVEAYAKGTPVIVADIGAIAELVDHGRTGLLFTPSDATGLASSVKRMVQDRQTWEIMSHNARQAYEARYSAQHNYAMLMNVYERAIAAQGHS